MPDGVWQIVLVSLLWTFEYLRWEQTQLLREGIHQFRLVRSGAETADWKLALWTAAFIRDPYVFEFLGVPENKPMMESDLEKALIAQVEAVLKNWHEKNDEKNNCRGDWNREKPDILFLVITC